MVAKRVAGHSRLTYNIRHEVSCTTAIPRSPNVASAHMSRIVMRRRYVLTRVSNSGGCHAPMYCALYQVGRSVVTHLRESDICGWGVVDPRATLRRLYVHGHHGRDRLWLPERPNVGLRVCHRRDAHVASPQSGLEDAGGVLWHERIWRRPSFHIYIFCRPRCPIRQRCVS